MISRYSCWAAIIWGAFDLIDRLVIRGHHLPAFDDAGELGYLAISVLLIAIGVYQLILGSKRGYSDEAL